MRITLLLMVTALTFAACGDDESSSDAAVSAPTEPAAAEPVVSESPAAEPAVTESAVTEPAVTEPAVTEPPLADTTVSEPAPDPAAADDAECAPIAIDTGSVTLEGERSLLDAHVRYGGTLTRIAVSHADSVGGLTGWRPAMPVTQWSVVKS